jgi:hypothetical protein
MSMQDQFGQKPISFKWNVVRGDTAKLRIDFLENDETTAFNISSWNIVSSAYDTKGEVLDELDVIKYAGYIEVVAPSDITENWGVGYSTVIAELAFDVEVTIGNEIWTPVIGTIVVAADVTGGL